jgi:signal transduction histidine kinase/ActR/RegA family two-component response regulator
MNSGDSFLQAAAARDVVITTPKLARRAGSAPRYEAENAALVNLAGDLARSPLGVFQKLAEATLNLCRANGAGVSLLETVNDEEMLRARAVIGASAPRLGSLSPREFSPGGIALERQSVQLFTRPERYFTYLSAWPRISELLIAPFYVDGRPAGTLWAVAQDDSREFDAEDARLIASLAKFSAACCRIAASDRAGLMREVEAETDRSRNAFLATLAHELRNPLAPIRNAVQIMRDAENDLSTVAAARNMIERQLKHMVRLIDDLVDVSRLMQGRLELRTERVDLGTVLRAALETTRPLFENRQQQVNMQRPSEPVYVEADLTRLTQLFANILVNAARYSPPREQVNVTAESDGQRAIVTISDFGIGIPEHLLTRIFDLFPQATRSDQSGQGGLGIGLTLVKRIVELHEGTVEAQSDGPNRGSRFIVALPLADAPALSTTLQEKEALDSGSRLRPLKILVADDNKDSARSLEIILRLDGHEVQTANDGLEALEVAERFHPDVVLLDIGMPRLDGYATAHQLKRRPWATATRLIALTGWGQDEDKRRAREAGFDFHLLKPVDPEMLTRALEERQMAMEKPKTPKLNPDPPPIKEPNPGETVVDNPPKEVPKVGSRDAPGG